MINEISQTPREVTATSNSLRYRILKKSNLKDTESRAMAIRNWEGRMSHKILSNRRNKLWCPAAQ